MRDHRRYTVSDGKLVLWLQEAPEGGFLVRCPTDPELITEADTIRDAFVMAKDALKALAQSRAALLRPRS
ncbi:MAG: type II toxin-antitoxin system HicB family antitoxin [Planctomycetes bacterium]|nr:type II toxin-antitoxin system HicB family antitoxin [Planctomycetota bacterium]